MLHVVRDHQRRELGALDRRGGGAHHRFRRLGIERRRVFIEQQQFRRGQHRHQQGQRLPLSAGEEFNLLPHAIFKTEAEFGEVIAVAQPRRGRQSEAKAVAAPSPLGERKIFLDGHDAGGADQRVLKHPRDGACAFVRRLAGDILAVDDDCPGIRANLAGDGIEERALARAVAADDYREVAGGQLQRHIVVRDALVRRSCEARAQTASARPILYSITHLQSASEAGSVLPMALSRLPLMTGV